jgi:signal transduction histidine kinase
LALTQYEVLRSRIAVHTELTAEPVAVHGDPVQLQQVLLNLLLNAIEAIDAKTEGSRDLIIRSRTTGRGQIEVSIHDSGIGIALPHMDQIFNVFHDEELRHGDGSIDQPFRGGSPRRPFVGGAQRRRGCDFSVFPSGSQRGVMAESMLPARRISYT